MQDLTSIHSSAFLQNYQMLKQKTEKRSYIFTVERVSGQAAHNYAGVSKSWRVQNMFSLHQCPTSGEGHCPRFWPYHYYYLYRLSMRNENILLLLQFYLPQGVTVQNSLQSPSSTDRLAKGQILQNFLGKQNTLPAVLFAFQSHAASSAPYFSFPAVDPGLCSAFMRLLLSHVHYFLIFFISNKQNFADSFKPNRNNTGYHAGVQGIFCFRARLYWRRRENNLTFFCRKSVNGFTPFSLNCHIVFNLVVQINYIKLNEFSVD